MISMAWLCYIIEDHLHSAVWTRELQVPVFTYRATNLSGVVSEGTMEAREEQTVVAKLQADGFIPIRVSSEAKPQPQSVSISLPSFFTSVSKRDILALTQELATLLEAGLPLDRSLKLLAELTPNQRLRDITNQVLSDVEGGKSLGDALAKHPKVFSRLYVNLVRAGEVGGVMAQVLRRMAEFLERAQDLRDDLSSAMAYPAFLLLFSGGSLIVVFTFVIPQFAGVFEDAAVSLPLPMQWLLVVSALFQGYWWLVLLGIVGGLVLLRLYTLTPTGAMAWDQFTLKLPLLGPALQKAEVAGLARTLGTLLHNGVPILHAMEIVKETLENRVFARAIEEAREKIKTGIAIGTALKQIDVFPTLATQMTVVGDETGRLDAMLLTVADTYDRQVRVAIKRLTAVLGPILILGLAVLVGGIVISMLLAIISINELPI